MNPALKLQKLPGRYRLCGSAFCVALLTLSSHAIAQTTTTTTTTETAATPAPATDDKNDVVKLSPFVVSSDKDYGYAASNSIAGTRTNTPIKDIPLNVQVFTKDLADDLLVKNQVDFESYNASLVNGSADRFSDNVIQQSYQNFLFRGFRQNWGLRDGIREYDPIDTQGLSRVEVVKGPAAALYGLAYPGGVMNNISKTADFNRSFGSVRVSAGGEGDYRGTIDTNVVGKLAGGQVAIRYNGVYEQTEDVRAHSIGKVRLEDVALSWAPIPTTQFDLLIENGFRAKPNGIGGPGGYFQVAEAGASGNGASIPLQILHPEISWNWNWSNGANPDSLETHLYRGTVTQKIGDNFNLTGYIQYSSRLETPGQGWDASGSGGANSWENAGSGWDQVNNRIISTYNYRDWGNKMHAYGATGVYKLDLEQMKNTFTFGANVWGEKELSRENAPLNPLASAIYYPITQGINTSAPQFAPADTEPQMGQIGDGSNGYHHEDNSNDYYFAAWQASFLGDKLKTNVGINETHMKLLGWNNGVSPAPDTVYKASKLSPLFGAIYEVTKEYSVFAVHSTSLFPDSTKDSFGHTFSPQVGSSYEFGVKFDVDNSKFSGTVSYYDIKQTGGSQNDPNHDNVTTARWDSLTPAQRAVDPAFAGHVRSDFLGDIIQGGEQEAKGFDVDLVYQPIRQWQMVFSYAHTNHQFTQSAVASTIGETYPEAIKDRYSLLSKYSFIDGDLKGAFAGIGITGGSKALQNYFNWNGHDVARYEPARTTVNLFGGYKVKVFGYNSLVQLNINNVTKTSDYEGWKATGSSAILSTQMYKVPLPIVYRLTLGLDF